MAATLGMPKASLTNWVRADAKGQLAVTSEGKATTPTITPEQQEIARLRAQVARLTMERDIAKNVFRGSAPSRWKETRVLPTLA